MTVFIENEQDKANFTQEMEAAVRSVAFAAMERAGYGPLQATVIIVDDVEIRHLNRDFRGIDSPTDVLSFPMLEFDKERKPLETDVDPETGEITLGDIAISLERAYAQAEEYGHLPLREVAFLTAHGMLHLLGYDHETEAEESEMFALQENILAELGITRDK